MKFASPMKKSKQDYKRIIRKIGATNAVGIDPQLTHAMIIDYLQQINGRLEKLEKTIKVKHKT